ncbi:flagellar hook-associated protein FlgK [Neptunomonas qingdaonensis]|uniref:Flagellar hook-associated protein 1 n=1 Tax=Neptunomonas qingdaonensis TaxID=1045558 RepID=A0A1I2N0Z2_9GAMM|nr:flagellar hook-associated protein FlgK [Neptunomonas qingdaonensis]SFF97534.1 flagellar hook-associated protein 1 FlgK [Neptunomonas qingdaonensis]
MSSFNLLNLGNQALRSNQSALSTVGQNISNVNTPGYSRQIATFSTLPDQTGVQVDSVDRITNRFLTQQLWSDLSSYNQTSTYADMSGELDNLLATNTTSVSNALDQYFSALQNVVDDPVSIANRELFVAQSDAVVKRFNDLDAHISRQSATINGVMDDVASQINSLASSIAELNDNIQTATSSGNPANELKDQREELTNQLSEMVGIRVLEQGEQFSVFIGNGQPLVVGTSASQMQSLQGDPDSSQNDLALIISGQKITVTDELSGGSIGGLLQYRDEALDDARDELGRMAIGFAESMNTLHSAGMDLNNELGGDLFKDVNSAAQQYSRISSRSDNQSSMRATSGVSIQDISKLQASDYELTYDSDNSITLIRNSDGKQMRINQLAEVKPELPATSFATTADALAAVDEEGEFYLDADGKTLSFQVDGMKVTLKTDTRLSNGDTFLIQPVRTGAEDLSLQLQDGRKLALASPVRVTPDSDNNGSGVATVSVTDPDVLMAASNKLDPPIDIVFNNPDASVADSVMTYTVYDMSEPSNPQALSSSDYEVGKTIELNGYDVVVEGLPTPGDRFSFSFNKDGVSDNRNALALSDLQQKDIFDGGAYQDLYGSLIERVGTRTSSSRVTMEANKAVLDSTVTAKSSVSGVNLDEEAAKLVQFQQAYQASAQLIKTSQTLFDSLLNSI